MHYRLLMIIVAVSVFANSRVHAQDPCLIGKYVVTIISPTAGAMVMPDKDGFFTVKGTITWTGVGNVAPTNIKVTVTPDGGAPTTFNFTDTVITPTAGGGKSVDYSNAKASGKKGKNVVRVQGMNADDKFLLDPCEIIIYIP